MSYLIESFFAHNGKTSFTGNMLEVPSESDARHEAKTWANRTAEILGCEVVEGENKFIVCDGEHEIAVITIKQRA